MVCRHSMLKAYIHHHNDCFSTVLLVLMYLLLLRPMQDFTTQLGLWI